MTLTLPPELELLLLAEARRRSCTPEQVALQAVETAVTPQPIHPTGEQPRNLLEFLGAAVGSVQGTGEAFSQDCGKRFGDGLAGGRDHER